VADEIFDPEIHATDPKTGEPSLNKDGSFRKRRRDAGRKTTTSAAPKSSGSSGNATRERYRRNVDQVLGIPVVLLSMQDPVLGYAAGELAPMWSAGLADLAVEQPRLAAALERAGNLGAGAALLSAAVMTTVQIGHLMGKVPEGMAKMMGAKTRSEIEQILEQRGVELAARAKQQEAWDAEDAQMAAEVAEHLAAEREGARQHADTSV
jgi:hypothetical protein